jgi:hypothetical protein
MGAVLVTGQAARLWLHVALGVGVVKYQPSAS